MGSKGNNNNINGGDAAAMGGQLKIYFVLKIHYQINEQEGEEAEGTITGSFASKNKRSNGRA